MTVLRLVGDAEGDAYVELLRFLMLRATTFSLTMERRPTASSLNALAELRPYEIEVREVNEWPGSKLPAGKTAKLHVYGVGEEAMESLRRLANGLFAWQAPELPDDLCFYRADRSVILETVASEEAAALDLRDDELRDFALFPAIIAERDPPS